MRAYRTSTPRLIGGVELLPALGLDGEATPTFPVIDCRRAHLCHGYSDDRKMMQIGQLAVVDDYGVLPVLAHCLDGNQNGHPRHPRDLLAKRNSNLALPDHMFPISGTAALTCSSISRLHNAGYAALCPGQWKDYRAIYDANFHKLDWQPASFPSLEQQRCRAQKSDLPHEHYEIAVLRHQLIDPATKKKIRSPPLRLQQGRRM